MYTNPFAVKMERATETNVRLTVRTQGLPVQENAHALHRVSVLKNIILFVELIIKHTAINVKLAVQKQKLHVLENVHVHGHVCALLNMLQFVVSTTKRMEINVKQHARMYK